MTEKLAIIIVDHGSQRPESNAMLEAFVEAFRGRGRFAIVEPAHMELAEPSLATAFDRCVARGAKRVIVAPYFFWPGIHMKHDVPDLTAAAAANHPGVKYAVAEPIGLHPLMHDVIESRIDACLNGQSDDSKI